MKFLRDLFVFRNVPSILVLIFIGIGVFNPMLLKMEPVTVVLAAIGALAVENIIERLTYLSRIQDEVSTTNRMVTDVKNAVEHVEMDVIEDDNQIPDLVLKITDRVRVSSVQILSSGLTTRQIMVANLLKKGIHVQALLQDPLTALDKKDKDRVATALGWIEHHRESIRSGLLDARFHINVSTVRAIIVTEEVSDTKHIFLSWYYYLNKNTKVQGEINPTIYCTTLSKQGSRMYEWLCRVFQKDLAESRKITARDFKQKEALQ
jgi:hypothetical protein